MEALKLKATTANGKLTVAVPDEFDNREVEIIVLSTADVDQNSSSEKEKENDDRVARLLSVIGTAKYPEKVIDKYNVYEQ